MKPAPGDQTAILGWNTQNSTSIIVGSSNYEQGAANSPSAYVYQVTEDGIVRESEIPGALSSTGAMAASDYDNDGDVDLFIGSRFKPVQYPKMLHPGCF